MKTVVIYSGGLDSTVLLYKLRADGHEVHPLGVNYGQRHARELDAAKAICSTLGVPYRVADLTALRPFLAGSSQTSDDVAVPHGHYEDETMRLTVVPNRNMIMLAVAIGWAISLEAEAVAYAAHAGDHAIYPDCRADFVVAMQEAARQCHYEPGVQLVAPFIGATKAAVVSMGADLGVPFAYTWSCYEGGGVHCGRCGTCVERREAFQLAGVTDPTVYAS